MRLLKLYSDFDGFREIEFNEKGFTFIFGEKIDENTYNGTGKTLSLYLIDFCLGSNKRDGLAVLNANIYLDFIHDDVKHTVKRNTTNQNDVFLDDNKYNLTQFKKKIASIVGVEIQKFISIRTKLAMHLRYKKSAFLSPIDFGEKSNEYQYTINILEELGFNTKPLYDKITCNTDYNTTKKFIKELKTKEIKDVLIDSTKQIDVERRRILAKIDEKEKQLKVLKVAENISELKHELSRLRKQYNDIINTLVIKKKNLAKINESKTNNIYISEQYIVEKYDEFKTIFGESVVKEIEDVLQFRKDLIDKRTKRFQNDIIKLENDISLFEEKKENIQIRIDEIYKSLESSIDLPELTALTSELTQLKIKLEKISSYSIILKDQESKKLVLERDFSNQNIAAQEYLDSVEDLIQKVCDTFNKYVFTMYGDVDSYIRINNNTQQNSSRFNIDVKVPSDSSDGIQNAEIMCFDLMMNEIGKNVFNFVIHDNKIFYGWDYSVVSKILVKLFNDNIDYQYIVTINQSDYDEIKKEMRNDELFTKIIEDNIKIRLTSEKKLLGRTIEIEIDE